MQEIKNHKKFVKGKTAIERLMSGKWKYIRCNNPDWIRGYSYIRLYTTNLHPNKQHSSMMVSEWLGEKSTAADGTSHLCNALAKEYYDAKLWSEYKRKDLNHD
jgi:hypothetical protein